MAPFIPTIKAVLYKRGLESALHGILVNLELLYFLHWKYARFILMRNKTELILEVKKIVEDVALIPRVERGCVHCKK